MLPDEGSNRRNCVNFGYKLCSFCWTSINNKWVRPKEFFIWVPCSYEFVGFYIIFKAVTLPVDFLKVYIPCTLFKIFGSIEKKISIGTSGDLKCMYSNSLRSNLGPSITHLFTKWNVFMKCKILLLFLNFINAIIVNENMQKIQLLHISHWFYSRVGIPKFVKYADQRKISKYFTQMVISFKVTFYTS